MGYYLGIDVGTGSARAGIFDERGRRVGMATHPIKIWRPAPDHVEQSSEDIWRACARAARAESGARRRLAVFVAPCASSDFAPHHHCLAFDAAARRSSATAHILYFSSRYVAPLDNTRRRLPHFIQTPRGL